MRSALEAAAVRVAPTMNAQNVANTVWALATLGWQAQLREMKLAELRALKVPELKQLCDQHDVRKTGKKEELVARLCDALSNAEQPAEKTNFSKAEVLKMLDLPEMHSLLRQKRLRWVGHALRRKDGDLSKDTVKQELARKSSTWTACVLSDMEALNIGGVVALEREANNRESFRKLTSAYTQK